MGFVAVSMALLPALHTSFDRFVGCRERGYLEHGGRHGLGIRIGTPMASQTTALLFNPIEPFLEAHCYDCHSGADAEAGLDLESLALEQATTSDHEFSQRDMVVACTICQTRVRNGNVLATFSHGNRAADWIPLPLWPCLHPAGIRHDKRVYP